MSSSEKPPADAEDINNKPVHRSDSIQAATKSQPYIHDKMKTDKKQVNRTSKFSQSDGSIIKKPEENVGFKKKIGKVWPRNKEVKIASETPEKDAVSFIFCCCFCGFVLIGVR